jgi:tripartite-type tricarboxylate transporter receptor subunit TctC
MNAHSYLGIAFIVGLAAIANSQTSLAQSYPSRPIQLVNSSAEGGAGDFVARLLADKLARPLGQPVSTDNRPGASGITAAQSVARAAPDGYTLLVGHTAELAILQSLVKDLGYNPEKDLQPVALVALFPLALVVKSTVPHATIQDMLAQSRSSGGGLVFASSGPGTPGYLAGELLRLRTGSRLTHVPYDGGGPAIENLLQGRVDFYFSSLAAAMPHLNSGQLKALAVSTARRSTSLPNVPTMAETGIRNFDLALWVGVFAPRRTPREVVDRLNREINQILAQPDVRDRMAREGGEIAPMSPDQFTAFIRSDAARYAELIKDEFCSRLLFGGCLGFGALAD